MSGAFKLQTLLTLREQAQADAERGLREAINRLETLTIEQQRLGAQAQGLQARLLQVLNGPLLSRTAAALQARDQFIVRLRDDVRQSQQQLAHHQQGPLAQALVAESQARQALLLANQELELLNRHKDQADLTQRKSAERREDHAVDDWSQARKR